MRILIRMLAAATILISAISCGFAADAKAHRVTIQVDQNDPAASPVKDRLKQISEFNFPSQIKFSACNNTKEGMEKREGHPIAIVPQARLVPSGAVRLMELEEDGWSYLKP